MLLLSIILHPSHRVGVSFGSSGGGRTGKLGCRGAPSPPSLPSGRRPHTPSSLSPKGPSERGRGSERDPIEREKREESLSPAIRPSVMVDVAGQLAWWRNVFTDLREENHSVQHSLKFIHSLALSHSPAKSPMTHPSPSSLLLPSLLDLSGFAFVPGAWCS